MHADSVDLNDVTPSQPHLRSLIRDLLVGVCAALTSPCWIPVRIGLWLNSEAAFLAWGQFLSCIPGLIGVMLRRGYYRMCLDDLAMDAGIGFGTWFSHPQVRVAPGVDIGARCIIGMCDIGEHTLIGSHINILSGRHQHGVPTSDCAIPVLDGQFAKIHIGASSWIGSGSIVMADIGNRSIIGAGSVVVKPIPDNAVAVGNPCVVKKALSNPSNPDAVLSCRSADNW